MVFTEIDDKLMSENVENVSKTKNIYLIYNNLEEEGIISLSTGIVNKIAKKNKSYTLFHNCDTKMGSSGGPITLYNHKVIGVHRGRLGSGEKVATLLQFPIKEYLKKLEQKKLANNNKIKPKSDNFLKINHLSGKKERITIINAKDYKQNNNAIKGNIGNENLKTENRNIKTENERLKKENQLLKNKNQILKEENEKLKKRLNDLKIEEIKKINEKYEKFNDEKIKNNDKSILILNNNIAEIKNYNGLLDGEKLILINFISVDQKINWSIICKNKTKFFEIENELYQRYPEYRENYKFFYV